MRLNALITTAAVLIVLAAVNFLASRHPARADLTQNHIYTLSETTEGLARELSDVLTIRVYFSEDLPPALTGLRRDLDDLLAEFKGAAGDRIQIEHIDPASSGMEEQKVAMMGIVPVQYNLYQDDRVEVAKIYLGMAVLYGDKQEIIPVVHNTANLEYQLAEAILRVSQERLPTVGWLEAGSAEDEVSPYRLIRQALSRRYRINDLTDGRFVDLDPEEYSAVVLLSPRALSDESLFALDQYLMKGGRVMALVDRWEVDTSLALKAIETNAVDLLSHYGAEIGNALVMDESNAMAAFSGGIVTYHIHYPFWPEVRGPGFMRDQPITVNVESAVFPWTAPIDLTKQGSEREAAVAVSTAQAAAVEASGADLEPKSASTRLAQSAGEQLTLAALIEGPLHSYFASTGRRPPAGTAVVAEGTGTSRLFVAGSSRWVMDRFLGNFPQNAALFENALDYLAASDILIGIRSRENLMRPIALLPGGAMAFLRYANVAAGPAAVGLIGIGTLLMRRRRRRKIASKYRDAA